MADYKSLMGEYPPPSYPGETQPGAGVEYGGQPSYPGVALSPPQQTVMVVPQRYPHREGEAGAAVSMTGAYLSSCLTLWLCGNVLFGFIGFILAIIGTAYIGSNNKLSRQLSTASMVVTWVGFVITIILIVIVIVMAVEQERENENGVHFGDADVDRAVNGGLNEANKAVNGGLNVLRNFFTTTPKPWWG